MRAGDLDEKARNSLLSSMTDEVADLVLEDNRLQALALSIAQTGGDTSAASLIRVIEMLEDRGELDRHNEGLGSNESYVRRAAEGQGLTRPELAVLLSSAKLALQDAIENCDLADDDLMTDLLLTAFPEPMRDDYRERILNHRLRRELVATRIANLMVNRLGITTPFEIAEEEGAGLSQVAAAFIAAMHLFELEEVWQRLDDAKMNEDARLTLFKRSADALRGQIADVLRAGGGDVCPSQIVDRLAKPVAALSSDTDELLAAQTRQHSAQMRADFPTAGAPEKEAAMVAHLFDLDGAAGIASLAVDVEIEPRVLTNAFTLLGSRLGLDWAQGTAAMMNPSDPWERLLVAGLARDFQQMRLEFLRRLARRKNAREDLTAASEEWLNSHAEAVQQFGSMIARAQSNAPVAPAVLAQIASQARNLLQR
jgi:glutamate dehydrogenase